MKYQVEPPGTVTRLELAVRIVALVALGLLGISFGALFMFAYLVLPVIAASRLSAGRDPEAYLREDGSRIVAALRWFAAVSAWASLVAARLPMRAAEETVRFTVEASAHPTPSSALWRVVTGLPSAFVLVLLSWIGFFAWIWAAISVLLFERVGPGCFGYLVGLQRWSLRLLVYQASLIDEYPPFTLSDEPLDPHASSFPTT